jgi:AhpD family alkylhydroperoxidase
VDKTRLREIIAELATDQEETVNALLELTEESYGSVPLVFRVLSRRPDVFIPARLKSNAMYVESKVLDRKTNELLAVAAATALRCEHCLLAHVDRALASGATAEEVLQAMLVASAIAESSSWSLAFRVLNRVEDRLAKQQASAPDGGAQ